MSKERIGKDLIERFKFFDGEWYEKNYPDSIESNLLPLEHYISYGLRLNRWPCDLASKFEDIADSIIERVASVNEVVSKIVDGDNLIKRECAEKLIAGDDNALYELRNLAIQTGEKIYRNLFLMLKSCFNIHDGYRQSVLFVAAGLKGPSPGGGIGTCFYNMIKSLKDQPVDVTALYVADPYYSKGNYEFWKDDYEKKLSVNFLRLNCNNKDYGSKEMKRSYAIKEYLLQHSGLYDRVVFHDFYGLAYYTLLTKRLGLSFSSVELLISAHGNHKLSYHFNSKKVETWSEHAIFYMEKESLRMADKVTTPSEYYAGWLENNLGVSGAECIPNIIEMEKVGAASRFYPDEKRSIFFYGRAERLKGIDVLIEALTALDDKGEKGIELHVVGNKTKIDQMDSEEYILAKLKHTNLDVSFEYNVTPSAFFEKVQSCNGFVVFPTLGETSSCVVVESILSNTPFLVSNIEGIKELVLESDHSKVFFEAGNASSLVASIERAWHNGIEVPKLAFNMVDNIAKWQDYLTREVSCVSSSDVEGGEVGITVIVPTSDRPELLEATLKSLLAQEYKNFEIVVFDDASNEPRLNKNICEKLGVRYYFSKAKLYKGKACNVASQYATKDYICFFDDDDLAKVDMLKKYNIAVHSDESITIVSCFAEVFENAAFEEAGRVFKEYASYSLGNDMRTNILANFFGKGTFLVSKNEFFRVGGYEEDEFSTPMVDYRFYLKSSLLGANIATVPFELYSYRKNSPKSLYYENKKNPRAQFRAKSSIEDIFGQVLGVKAKESVGHLIWNVSLPKY